MKLSLSGWQRLGIVLTFLWAIGILLFTAHEFYSARSHLTNASPEDKQFKDLCFVGYYETQLKVMLPSKTVSRVLRENKYLSVAFEPKIKVLTVIIIILGPVLGGWLYLFRGGMRQGAQGQKVCYVKVYACSL